MSFDLISRGGSFAGGVQQEGFVSVSKYKKIVDRNAALIGENMALTNRVKELEDASVRDGLRGRNSMKTKKYTMTQLDLTNEQKVRIFCRTKIRSTRGCQRSGKNTASIRQRRVGE